MILLLLVGAVSFFPAGIIGNQTPNNQVDIFSKNAYSQWYQHVTRTASLVGYEVVRGLGVHKDDAQKSRFLGIIFMYTQSSYYFVSYE